MAKAISLISPGIDSPVASFFMKKKSVDIIYLHLSTDKAYEERVHRLVEKIDKGAKLIVKDFVPTLSNITKKANRRFTCVLCKRAMYREAEKLANELKADFIITGENLGQVASQTLENMFVLDKSVTIPVIRPLLCFDKQEIINIAKKIGTYDISSEKHSKCAFVPTSPVTRSKLSFVEKLEGRV